MAEQINQLPPAIPPGETAPTASAVTGTTVDIIVDNVIRIPRTIHARVITEILTTLTHKNPQYFATMRLGLPPKALEEALKRIPKEIKSWCFTDTHLCLPRGTGRYSRNLLTGHGYNVRVIDRRVVGKKKIMFSQTPKWQLREHQQKAHAVFAVNEQGVLESPCGGGKTLSACYEIAYRKEPTLIIVHTKDLLKQWRSELLEKFVFEDDTIGIIGEGEFNPRGITICMIQSLYRMAPERWKFLQETYGMVIVDECHHTPARTFLEAVNKLPARFRFGVTATPRRKDSMDFLLYEYIGPILYTIPDSELEDQGITMSVEVRKVVTEYTYGSIGRRQGPRDWVYMINDLVINKQRNIIIARNIIEDVKDGRFVLVLSDRVEHCQMIKQCLDEHNIVSRLLLGKISSDERSMVKREALAGRLDVVIGTSVADEGLDMPNLDTLHLTCPSNNKNLLKQRVGRIKRSRDGKRMPRVYDYVDHYVTKLGSVAQSRFGWYRKWGFTILD